MNFKQIAKQIKNLFSLGEVNPVQDEKLIFKILLATERGAIVVVAIVSGIAVAAYGYLLASGYTEWEWVRWTTAILMFGLATAITDVGVKFFIQKGAYDFFAAFNPATYKRGKVRYEEKIHGPRDIFIYEIVKGETVLFIPEYPYNWFQRAMQFVGWLCMVGLIAGMFLFDYISTDSVRKPVANMVRKESKLNQDSIREITAARENVRVGAVVNAIQSTQADINTTKREIEAAKNSAANSNGKMKRLADSGNGWAKSQIKAAQSKAAAPIQKRLNELEALKNELQQQQARDLAYKSAVISKSDSTVFADNAAIESRNNDLVTGTSTMFIWLGFWCKCIAGLIRIMLVVLFLASNQVDANNDGKIDHRDVTAAAEQGFRVG